MILSVFVFPWLLLPGLGIAMLCENHLGELCQVGAGAFSVGAFFHARVQLCENLAGGTLIIDTCAQFVMFGRVEI